MKEIQNKQTQLAKGHIFLYRLIVHEKEYMYYFMGMVTQSTTTVTSCKNKADMNHRIDCLLECDDYILANDTDVDKLMTIIDERIRTNNHLHPNKIEPA